MINLERARELLKQAVETQGEDFVYQVISGDMCYYRPMTEEEEPDANDPKRVTGCLVGTALTLAGETRHLDVIGSVGTLFNTFPDMMTTGACDYFQAAQNLQDQAYTWGDSYDAAEDGVKDGTFR